MSRDSFFLAAFLRGVSALVALSLLGFPSAPRVLTASVLSTPTTALGKAIDACRGGGPVVLVLVEPALVRSLHAPVSRFVKDLCEDGYAAVAASPEVQTPLEVRHLLADLYETSGRQLVGAILVGEFPHAYQFVHAASANPIFPAISEEVISYQFYADLDGTFAASSGYTSPGGHAYSYDVHGGAVDWEIWIGVLPRYKGDLASSATALKDYFKKNRAFRKGTHPYPLPRRFLLVSEHWNAATLSEHNQFLSDFRTGPFAWTPWSSASDALIYFNSPPAGVSIQQATTCSVAEPPTCSSARHMGFGQPMGRSTSTGRKRRRLGRRCSGATGVP